MFWNLIITLFIILFLIESDRTYIIPHELYSYYIQFFPKQILYGIHNTLQRLRTHKCIYNTDNIKLTKFLEKNKKNILNEFYTHRNKSEIMAHNTTTMLKKDKNYRYIFFKMENKLNKDNCSKFQCINNLLKLHPNIKTCFLSIMYNKKTIPYHRGPYNGLLRYHFPLIVKPNSSYLEVMGRKLDYSSSFMFDDTYPHKFVKLDNSVRVVLICDIENPYSLFHPHKLFY